MSLKRLATIIAPVGAVGMFLSALIPYDVFKVIGEIISVGQSDFEVVDGLMMPTRYGLAGASLLSLGMVIATAQRLQPTRMSRAAFILAAAAFGLACLLIAYGNTQLFLSFNRLATSESFDIRLLESFTEKARLPMLLGYVSVVIGAAAMFLANGVAPRESTSTPPGSGNMALIVAMGGCMVLCLATVWTTYSVQLFAGSIGNEIDPGPTMMAHSVNGIINSVYLSLFGLAGFCLASLLCAIASGPADARQAA